MKRLRWRALVLGYDSVGEDLGKGRKDQKGPSDSRCIPVCSHPPRPPSEVRREWSTGFLEVDHRLGLQVRESQRCLKWGWEVLKVITKLKQKSLCVNPESPNTHP